MKIFNWLATLWRGNISLDTPMLFALGFLSVFTIGGLSGIYLAAFPVDWQVHDTYFVVAHFHYVLFGGSIFGILGGLFYWWPKIFGRFLDDRLGKWTFWLLFVGFNVTFFPQHMLGLMGMVRRIYTYQEHGLWEGYNMTSTIGSYVMSARHPRLRGRDREERQRPQRRQRPVARRHARVVHDVAAAAAQLRLGAVRDERPARSTTCAASSRSAARCERARHGPGPAAPGRRARRRSRLRRRRRDGAACRAARLTRASRWSRCRCSPASRSRPGGRIRGCACRRRPPPR